MKDEDADGRSGPGGREDLQRLLGLWEAPEPSSSLDDRVLASFRRQVDVRPFWLRFFTSSIRVPLPVAVAALLLLLASALLAVRRPTQTLPEASALGPPTMAAEGPAVPVVTHTSLAGFEPARESDTTVVLEGS
jgi:hypothetical protein